MRNAYPEVCAALHCSYVASAGWYENECFFTTAVTRPSFCYCDTPAKITQIRARIEYLQA